MFPRLSQRLGAWAHAALQGTPAWALLPAVLFYDECVFRLGTGGRLLSSGTGLALLFCLCYGGALTLLLALFLHLPRLQRLLTLLAMALTALPYGVEYFVYQAFHVFYDVNTVLGGAADVARGFGAQARGLMQSGSGLVYLLLLALPCVAYALWGARLTWPRRGAAALGRLSAGVLALSLLMPGIIACSPAGAAAYWQQYNYQAAVRNFGLLTALRLDIGQQLHTAPPVFDTDVYAAPVAEDVDDQPAQEQRYGYNRLPLALQPAAADDRDPIARLDTYVNSLVPTRKNAYTGLFAGKNLIFITAEAFCAEAIDPDLTPTLYRMATRGIRFTDYYQPASAGTTGGEYQNLLGLMPTAGGRSFKKSADHTLCFTLGSLLDQQGYYGKAYHNNDYTYYDRHRTHINLGYSDGFMGYGNGMEAYVTRQWPQSDREMIDGTLPEYIDRQPFNVYYMSVSGHGPYGRGENAMTAKNWPRVAALDGSDPVKGYLAANLELEDAMADLLAALEEAGIAEDTVVCLAADHFPYGLDYGAALGAMPYLSELYGEPVTDYLYRDHSRLLLWCGCLEKEEPITVDSPTFSLDILPTLCNLFGLAYDSRLLPGRDVFSGAEALVFDLNYDWKTERGTYLADGARFIPAPGAPPAEQAYIDRIERTVRNKIQYCKGVLETDYFAHIQEVCQP